MFLIVVYLFIDQCVSGEISNSKVSVSQDIKPKDTCYTQADGLKVIFLLEIPI